MLSKKNQELIDELMSTHDDSVKKEVEKYIVNPALVDIDETNKLSARVKCYHCGFEGEIDTRAHVSCPCCGTQLVQGSHATYTYNKFIMGDDGFTVLQYETLADFTIDDSSIETTLKSIGIFENNTISFFEDMGVWAKKMPKNHYYYNYGRDSKSACNLNETEQKDFRRRFDVLFKHIPDSYRYSSGCAFTRPDFMYRLSEAYKTAIRDKEIIKTVRKKEDKTPDVKIPKISAAQINRVFPAITKIDVHQEGLVYIATCQACGHKFPAESRYHSPEECPACNRKKMNDAMTGSALAAYSDDDGILVVSYDYKVKPVFEKGHYIYKVHAIDADAAFYVNEDGVFFYEVENWKATKTTCSEINSTFQKLKNNYRYNYDYECFIGGAEAFIKTLEESHLKMTGIIEFGKYQLEDSYPAGIEGEAYYEQLARQILGSINYLNIWNNCKAVEQLAKSKMTQLLKDITTKVSCPKFIQKKETTPNKILGLTKAQFKEIRDADISQSNFEIYKRILELDPTAAFADCTRFMNRWNMPDNVFEILALNLPKINMKEIERYAQSLDDYQCMEWTEGIRLWKDYLKMCIDLKCDMNDRTVIFTNNLKLEHDRTVRKYNNIKSQNAIKNFEEAVERYKHLEFEDEEHDFMIIAPKTQEELYEEGRVLHHCVGSYAKSVAEGRSTILFIRSKTKPTSPLCTVEVANGRLVQARTKYNNAAYTVPGVKKFMQAWAKEKKIILTTR